MPLIRKPSNSAPAAGPVPAKSSSDEHWEAARAMGERGDVAGLAGALKTETNLRVRTAILTALAQIATPESAEAVLPYLRSDDALVRTGALDALRAMPAAVKPRLPELLRDSDPDVRVLACEIVRNLHDPAAEGLLCDMIAAEQDANVCGAAVEVLSEIGSPDAIPALIACSARFPGHEFLGFAITVAIERLRARPVIEMK